MPILSWQQTKFAQLADPADKTWLVTEATGGIGLAISQEDAQLGTQVIVIGRVSIKSQQFA